MVSQRLLIGNISSPLPLSQPTQSVHGLDTCCSCVACSAMAESWKVDQLLNQLAFQNRNRVKTDVTNLTATYRTLNLKLGTLSMASTALN